MVVWYLDSWWIHIFPIKRPGESSAVILPESDPRADLNKMQISKSLSRNDSIPEKWFRCIPFHYMYLLLHEWDWLLYSIIILIITILPPPRFNRRAVVVGRVCGRAGGRCRDPEWARCPHRRPGSVLGSRKCCRGRCLPPRITGILN